MRHVFAGFVAAAVAGVAMSSPVVRAASAEGVPTQAPAPAPTPTPTPAPKPPDCAACVSCVAACGTAYATCTAKCATLPDLPSQQACIAACPAVTTCAAACPCGGCPTLPSIPH